MAVRLTVVSTAGFGIIVGLVVAAVWIPSAIISTSALVAAREDQMLGSLSVVRGQALNFFHIGSRALLMMQRMHKSATTRDPTRAPQQMMLQYSEAMWHFLKEHPTVSILSSTQLMQPEFIGHPTCDLSAAVFSGVISINVFEGQSGVSGNKSEEGCRNETSPYPCGEGRFRARFIKGIDDYSAPAMATKKYADVPCGIGIPSTMYSWKPAISPLTNSTFHGFTENMWDKAGRLQGKKGERATVLRVSGPVEGPPWAPLSGLVSVQMRVSDPAIPTDTSMTLNDIIKEATQMSDLRITIALITSEMELIGSSLGIENSRRDSSGDNIGFVAADNRTAVSTQIATVASRLRSDYCHAEGEDLLPWERLCNWSNVERLQHFGGLTVTALPVEDLHASGLGMLIVSIAVNAEIREPAEELSIQLAIICPIILVVGCAFAFAFAYAISKPIATFCCFLQDAADMRDLELIARERNRSSYLHETVMMRRALSDLVGALLEYKTYLPSTMFKEEQGGEQTSGFQGVVDNALSQPPSEASRVSTQFTVGVPEKDKTGRTVCVLRRRKCVVMVINLASWTQHVLDTRPESVSQELHSYIAQVRDAVKRKGTIDRFNGDQVVVSWNTSYEVHSYRKVACQAAHDFRTATVGNDWLTNPIGIGIAGGTVLSGNAGSNNIRAFNIIGVPVTHAFALAQIASQHSEKVVILISEQVVETGLQYITPIAGHLEIRKLVRQKLPYRKVFHEMLDSLQHNDEWLYATGEHTINKIIDLSSKVFRDCTLFPSLCEELQRYLAVVRCNMVFADKGWSALVDRIGEGDPSSLFHEV